MSSCMCTQLRWHSRVGFLVDLCLFFLLSTSSAAQCPALSALWPVAFWGGQRASTSALMQGIFQGQSNVVADLLSRRDQVIGTEWSLHRQVARALLCTWGSPSLDLFAMSLIVHLLLHCYLILDPQAVFEDAFCHPWDNLDINAFHPFLSSEGWWLESERPPNLSLTLVAPLCPEKEWFADLFLLLT